MKRIVIIFILLGLLVSKMYAGSCLPNGITFSTQYDVDYFLEIYGGCNEIIGDVTIEGNDINNLDNLHNLTKINGSLNIKNCPNLTDIFGLRNLSFIGGTFEFYNNDKKTHLYGLGALADIGGDLIIQENNKLVTLTGGSIGQIFFPGLNNLINIGGGLFIHNNLQLKDLFGLEKLISINGNISINNNDLLTSISDLSGIDSGVETIQIVDNPILTNLNGLQNINLTAGDILIQSNNSLIDLSGLEGINSIGWNLHIWQNNNLQNLHGIENIHTIGKGLQIKNNSTLTDLMGLENINSIGENFEISSNSILADIFSLNNLTSIGGTLSINSNPLLLSLQGIDNIDYNTITYLSLRSNSQLSICDVQSICNYLENGGGATIIGNATNCNSVEEVNESCSPPNCTILDIPEDGETDVDIYTNLSWNSVDNALGYIINIGTVSYGSDLVENEDLGNVTIYQYNGFPCSSTIYVTITSYNEHGDAIDCQESSFTTEGVYVELMPTYNICLGDSVQLYVNSNGTDITWSNSEFLDNPNSFSPVAFPEVNTTFAATVTNENGCSAYSSTDVIVFQPVELTLFDFAGSVCPNECTGVVGVLGNGGLQPYSYIWDNGETASKIFDLCSGKYNVTVTDSIGCMTEGEIIVNEVPEIIISIDELINVTDSTKGSISITVNNHSKPYAFEWKGIDFEYNNENEDINNLDSGCYQLIVTDSLNNCIKDTIICIEDNTTGIQDFHSQHNLVKVFPNPAKDKIYIKLNTISEAFQSISIIDISGRVLLSQKSDNTEIDVSSVNGGLYFVKIKFDKGSIYKKILIFD